MSGPLARTITLDGRTLDDGAYSTEVFSRPRCITRDLYRPALIECCSYGRIATLLDSHDIHAFRSMLDDPAMGAHGNGHIFVGGENLDFYSSPNDPIFFLHHAMLDRVWAIWQSQDAARLDALDGTVTYMNGKQARMRE